MMFTCNSTLGRPLRAGARHRPIDTHSGAGKSHQAYLWSCCIGTDDRTQAVIYDFAESRAGKHALASLGDWLSPLICNAQGDYMTHTQRKFFELQKHERCQIAAIYAIGQEARERDCRYPPPAAGNQGKAAARSTHSLATAMPKQGTEGVIQRQGYRLPPEALCGGHPCAWG